MQIPKPSAEAAEHFRALIPETPGVTVKPMFGNLGAFVNGNMFAGLFGDDIGIRVTDAGMIAELQAVPGSGPFGPAERPMGGYVTVPADWRNDPGRLDEWIHAALAQVGALPPKQPKARKKAS